MTRNPLMSAARTLQGDEYAHLSFKLRHEFVQSYEDAPIHWGFSIGGGNTLGELTFLTKYSRIRKDGMKERWHQCCERVINGMFSILKDHCLRNKTPWDEERAHRSAQEAYHLLFNFRWTPPGRGLAMMGTEFVSERGSAALQNCAFLSTQDLSISNPTDPFVRLMEMSMLGIGVGFDTLGAGNIWLYEPHGEAYTFVVPDSREGWCDSVTLLLESYFLPGFVPVEFDYSQIRAEGEPIKGFGGIAAGPDPLIKLHTLLNKQLNGREGDLLTSTDIVDIQNKIGKCVASGNVRRSAELALGSADDEEFLDLKNWELNPERMGPDGWGNLSNNSILASQNGHYDHLVPRIATGSEPGLIFMDLMRSHGRLKDEPNYRDYRAAGINPCAEQTLEDKELCTLVETYPINATDYVEYERVLKWSYLYGKAVTLLPTHWDDSNEIMQRNRRIGTSVSGVVQFIEKHGWSSLRQWLDSSYDVIQKRDTQYSEWLGVRESIKTTSVKPSGTVSRLADVTPGISFPTASGKFVRRDRYHREDPIVKFLAAAGYEVETDVMNPDSDVVVSFPVQGHEVRSEFEVTIWEKVALGAMLQEYWADNSVSATYSFQPHEAGEIGSVIKAFDGRLKAMAFMAIHPMDAEDVQQYAQLPFEDTGLEDWTTRRERVSRLDTEALYSMKREAEGEQGCANDTCEL